MALSRQDKLSMLKQAQSIANSLSRILEAAGEPSMAMAAANLGRKVEATQRINKMMEVTHNG